MFKHRIARLRAWFKSTRQAPEPIAAKAPMVIGPRVQLHMRRAARKAEAERAHS